MRFSATAVLALPLLASAAESPFEQYKAKFQNFIGSFGAAVAPGSQESSDSAGAASTTAGGGKAAKIVPKVINIESLTLQGWKDTLYAPVKPEATQPEEWWVLVTGGNKTCFGHCGPVEKAFNETVAQFALLPTTKTPHVAVLNCDDEPVLCNSWSASTGNLWVFDILAPPPAPVDVYWRRLNLTTTTAETLLDIYNKDDNRATALRLLDPAGYFHPFHGKLAQYGLAVPFGYALWAINAVPSWAMMLFVSFASRSMMNRRMDPNRAPGAPRRAAPAGDAL